MEANLILDRLDQVDQKIRSRSILEHPFYVAWNKGELTREQLQGYAEIYYPHVAAFPRYLESAIASTEDPGIRAELEDNLREELAVPKAHNELWLDFAEGLGLDREVVEARSDRELETVETFDRLTRSSTASAIAALYAYESQQPEVAALKAEGLRNFYGVEDSKTLGYFEVHAEADIRHRDGERKALGRCLASGATGEQALQATGEALDAYWALLDDVCDELGIEPS
ncbi:MAG: CADD family putative folate metabolism protein [Acidobacteriota bacterium]|nr:CADD family putative folate metabolism protein [Acidobacteriota bacterium]